MMADLEVVFAASDVIKAELDVVLHALKGWARFRTKDNHFVDIAAINSRTLDHLRGLSMEQWTEATQEAEERFW